MQKTSFMIGIALGLLFGLIWGSGYWADAKRLPGEAATQVELDRGSDGHFYADAEVDGHSVHFLVDTGASAIALTEEDARNAGIKVDPADYEFLGQGASGIVRGKEITLSKLSVDEISATDVNAVVVDGATVSLLGLPFLDEVDEIVIAKNKMTMRKLG